MKKMLFFVVVFISLPCMAAYTGNHKSKVAWVNIYNNDTIYFSLESMPPDHQCPTNYFILSPGLTEKQRDRYFSVLLSAKATGAEITVGYDKNNPDCDLGRPLVHTISY